MKKCEQQSRIKEFVRIACIAKNRAILVEIDKVFSQQKAVET